MTHTRMEMKKSPKFSFQPLSSPWNWNTYLEVEIDGGGICCVALSIGAGAGDPAGHENVVPIARVPVNDDDALAAL